MRKIVLILCLVASSYAMNKENVVPYAVNKAQICSTYEASFMVSAELYEETQNCYDLQYSILSFKQMLLAQCDIDTDYITIAYYQDKMLKQKCSKDEK